MDVHRIRFINQVPQSIQCLSFCKDGKKLALSRGDGSIEIWDSMDGEFFKKMWIPGRVNASIEALQWCGEKLFSGSLTGLVEEWDLIGLQPLRSINPCGGPIWCLQVNASNSQVATGCENGQVHLFDVIPELKLIRRFEKQSIRIISLAWHINEYYLAIGGADGAIRKFDVKTGRCVLTITQDASSKSIVWNLKYIDSFLVSADSLGRIHIWDHIYGTLIQSFKEYSADILALAVDNNNDIYCSGVDSKIVRIKKMKFGNEWIKDRELNVHTHDVRALDVSCDGFLASGGIDTQLFLTKTDKFRANYSSKYCQLQDSSRFFSIAEEANIVMHQNCTSIQLWRLPDMSRASYEMPINILEVKSKGVNHILCSAISSNAKYIAVSTVRFLWLYRLSFQGSPLAQCIRSLNIPSYKVEFCCNDTLLVLATIHDGIKLIDIETLNCVNLNGDRHLPITDFCCNKGGSLLLTKNIKNEVFLQDLLTGAMLHKFPEMNGPLFYSFSSDGKMIVKYSSKKAYFYDISESNFKSIDVKNIGSPKGLCSSSNGHLGIYDDKSLLLLQTHKPAENPILKCDGTILYVSMLCSGAIIIVEQLQPHLLSKLPQVLSKERYGT